MLKKKASGSHYKVVKEYFRTKEGVNSEKASFLHCCHVLVTTKKQAEAEHLFGTNSGAPQPVAAVTIIPVAITESKILK
ncbi:hypothetical protein V6N13_086984 [Hibiscus sabdariffa]